MENENAGIEKLNIIERFVQWYRGLEFSLSNLIATAVSLGAPYPAASLTWNNVQEKLGFSISAAWISAIVVEGLGFAALATIVEFWSAGRERKVQNIKDKGEDRGLMLVSFVSFLAYVIIVVVVNVLLEIEYGPNGKITNFLELASISMLTTLTIPGGLIYAVRTQFFAGRLRKRQALRDAVEEDWALKSTALRLKMEEKKQTQQLALQRKQAQHELEMEKIRVQNSVQNPVQPQAFEQKRNKKRNKSKVQLAKDWLNDPENNKSWFTKEHVPTAREIQKHVQDLHPEIDLSTAASSMQRARDWFIEQRF